MQGDTDDPDVPVLCDECGTRTRVPLSTVGEAVQRHNDQLHDGEDVAEIDPDVAATLLDLVAEGMGLTDGA
jgi:hypothetical protein